MWWEKVPDTPTARKIMKGWVDEVAEDALAERLPGFFGHPGFLALTLVAIDLFGPLAPLAG